MERNKQSKSPEKEEGKISKLVITITEGNINASLDGPPIDIAMALGALMIKEETIKSIVYMSWVMYKKQILDVNKTIKSSEMN